MTVKINDKNIYDKYTNQLNNGVWTNTNKLWNAYKFLGDLNGGEDTETVKQVIAAILSGEHVELGETRYYVKLKGLDTEYSYLEFFHNSFSLGDGLHGVFTKSWLKENWDKYDEYTKAGLLEFVEVEE